ncbi:MAG: hypothetical protein PHH54_06625 [Candidatus Nanoarchaeia archaeon]|nr:hypothetical protein [Candidatus Nanoarchaeia archaeon]MDD5741630.1 hypothetical protein [Candidatus Nanoarchaeia archaeon]
MAGRIKSENRKRNNFVPGEKVVYIPENKVYDFGYISDTGKAVIYEQGEINMQDSSAVDVGLLKRLRR